MFHLVVLAIILLLLPSTIRPQQPVSVEVDEEAVAELLEADTRDPDEAMKAISDQKASEEAESRSREESEREEEEKKTSSASEEDPSDTTEAESTEKDPSGAYGKTVLIGDSRFSEFKIMGTVPASQVCSFPGVVCFWVTDEFGWADELIAAANTHPAKAIFGAGIDEAGVYGAEIDTVVRDYEAAIDFFLSYSPGTQIYVNAIIPTTEEAIEEFPGRAYVDEYNDAFQEMCEERDWNFIDANTGFDSSYYSFDGIHFNWAWYPIWLANFQELVGGI